MGDGNLPHRVSTVGRGRVKTGTHQRTISIRIGSSIEGPIPKVAPHSSQRGFILQTVRFGSVLMILGTGLVVIGALMRFAPGLFGWFGNLPGDIRIEGESSDVFIPITSMIVASLALTVIVNVVAAVFRNR